MKLLHNLLSGHMVGELKFHDHLGFVYQFELDA